MLFFLLIIAIQFLSISLLLPTKDNKLILFPHLLPSQTLYLTCYQVAALETEWDLLSLLSPCSGVVERLASLVPWRLNLQCLARR